VPDPYFVMYTNVLELVGAEPVFYSLYPREPGGGWRPDLDEIASLVDERTKAILINTPGNPTGGVFDAKELAGITAIAEKTGAWIVSDEIYSHFVYDEPFHSVVSTMTDYGRSIVLGGFSKTYGIPGWRVGFAVGPGDVIDAMKLLQQYTFVCCPAPLQFGALAALSLDMSEQREAYRGKRDLVTEILSGPSGQGPFDLVPSEGSFYAFPAYPSGMPEQRFIDACLERKILIVPGSAFSKRATHFRLSFAAGDEDLRRGLLGLREIAEL
jgi:aspartate aminotransferase/aminotransferase